MQNWTPASHVSVTLLRLVARFFQACKGIKEVFKFDSRKKKKSCPELQLNCWISQKLWLWLAVLCGMMEAMSLVSPHFTVFLRAAWNGTSHLPGFVTAEMCWGLSRSNTPQQRKKNRKEKWPASEKLMTCSARLSGRVAASNLKLSGCSLTVSQNFPRGPVWFPRSLDHIPSPRHLQVSSSVWLQWD